MFRPAKWRTFLVASVARRDKTMPAMKPSRTSIIRPIVLCRAMISADASAAGGSKNAMRFPSASSITSVAAADSESRRFPDGRHSNPKRISYSDMEVVHIDGQGCRSSQAIGTALSSLRIRADKTFVSRMITAQMIVGYWRLARFRAGLPKSGICALPPRISWISGKSTPAASMIRAISVPNPYAGGGAFVASLSMSRTSAWRLRPCCDARRCSSRFTDSSTSRTRICAIGTS
jgi:hypothetical protein